jgi:hypothetical protein
MLAKYRIPALTSGNTEPPIGIEPMTYASRGIGPRLQSCADRVFRAQNCAYVRRASQCLGAFRGHDSWVMRRCDGKWCGGRLFRRLAESWWAGDVVRITQVAVAFGRCRG